MERDRKMKVKLHFLGFVGVLVAITLFLYFKNSGMEDKSDSQVTDEDVTQETESHEKEVNDEEVKKIEDKYKDDVADRSEERRVGKECRCRRGGGSGRRNGG